ncbi:MAG: phosphatidate cytidylyltransferase [Syntrophomonadaceae bacterium]|jgi:phosphatidate cytidylyltransferase|nr:phosphatidate cytidylyltransferase [Syntrophomonadaceae bacterium]
MLKTRLLTAAVGIPVLIGTAWLGGMYWTGLVALLALVATAEFVSMARQGGYRPVAMLALLLLSLQMAVVMGGTGDAAMVLLGLLLVSGVQIALFPEVRLADLALTWFGAVYIGVLFGYGLRIEAALAEPFFVLLLGFLLTWASDTGGYFAGRLLGRRKLAPLLSPGKTVEGSLGALLLTVAVAVAMLWGRQPLLDAVLLGGAASVLAQAGDLMESAMKRHFGVKDSGSILPGHGGVLDRFDSFMWVLPLLYYYFR